MKSQTRPAPASAGLPRQNPGPSLSVFGTPVNPASRFSEGEVQRASVAVPLKWVKVILVTLVVGFTGLLLFGLGIEAGQNSPAAQRPDAQTLAVLHYAQTQNPGQNCYAVWGAGDSAWSVKCGSLR